MCPFVSLLSLPPQKAQGLGSCLMGKDHELDEAKRIMNVECRPSRTMK
jgi:hypothetical protein